MTLTYPVLRDTRLHRPKRSANVEKKIKSETHFCSKNKGKKCTCSK